MSNTKATQECNPPKVTVYDGSVSMDVLLTNMNSKEGSVVSEVYENMKIEGTLTNVIDPNLHKTQAYQCTQMTRWNHPAWMCIQHGQQTD